MAESKLSKTARRSMVDTKNVQPKVIAWAWERGIKVGMGRKPDFTFFTEEEVKSCDPEDFIVVRTNSAWVGSASPIRNK